MVEAELSENWKIRETTDGRECKAGRARDVVRSYCLFSLSSWFISLFQVFKSGPSQSHVWDGEPEVSLLML